MSRVTKRRLGDIVNFKRGYDLPSYNRRDGLYPIISSGGVSGYHSEYKKDGEGLITGRYGTLGEMYYVNEKYWPHNTALYATDFKGNYPKYVYYLMKCLGNLKTSDKSTVPGVNRNDLHEIIIPYITPEFQRDIADFLFKIDAKIELNNRINRELEAMAQTLYDYWFVQFDFPNADGKPYKSSGGKMVYNAELKREIPEGWEASNVTKIADLMGGGTPSKAKLAYWNGDIPFFTPSDSDKNVYSIQTEDYITNEGLNNSSTRVFDKNTIFITARGSVGRLSLNAIPMAMNQSCYALKVKDGISYTYLYFLTKELIHHLEVKSSGSVFNSIVSNDIIHSILGIPVDRKIIEKFATIAEPIFKKIKSSTFQNQHLTALRDWLLPMLMNGQVSVRQAYGESEAAQSMSMAAEPAAEYTTIGKKQSM